MPPKTKNLIKPKGKFKARTQDPQSENDFLEAADEFEQAAGKWRAGDVVKATRFFNRAIDMYDAGLKRWPKSFDLAYNKANLEFKMSEDDRIVAQLGNKITLLEETLKSHRVAIGLDPDNTDVLFNTAQVLTSMAEALLENTSQQNAKTPAGTLLEEAVELFTKCLARQQHEYEEMQLELAKAEASQDFQEDAAAERARSEKPSGDDSMETASTDSDSPGEYATVVEPVTPEALLETCTAQLGALTTLLGLYDPADLATIEPKAQFGLETANTKIPTLINLLANSPFSRPAEEPSAGPTLSIAAPATVEPSTTPKDDALLATANFQASLAEIAYRSGRTTAAQYLDAIDALFAPLMQSPDNDNNNGSFNAAAANALSAHADALIDLASAVTDSPTYPPTPKCAPLLDAQWTALTRAQTLLTTLSTAPYTAHLPPSRLAAIYLARGDANLFRFRLAHFEAAKSAWVKSRSVLGGNAGVFYRGARMYAEKAGLDEVRRTAEAKAVVAEVLREVAVGTGVRRDEWMGKGGEVRRVLEMMVEEGVVGRGDAEMVAGWME